MDSRAKIVVFADTNLGTHLAIDVSPSITSGDLKREIEAAHLICFPKVGEIGANGLMVKQKSFFYHLPDSLPIKHVFQRAKGTWFIHVEACSRTVSVKSGLSECPAAEIRDRTSNSCNVTDSHLPKNSVSSAKKCNSNCRRNKRAIKRIPYLKSVLKFTLGTVHLQKREKLKKNLSKRKKQKRIKKNRFLHRTVSESEEGHSVGNEGGIPIEGKLFASTTESEYNEVRKSCAISENHSETLSETVSVSGIIKKYFSDYEEVTLNSDYICRANKSHGREQMRTGAGANCSEAKVGAMPLFTPKTPPRILPFPSPADLNCKTSRDKFKRTEVGKRLLVASNKLGISSSMQKSAAGFYRHGDEKLLVPKSSSLVKSIVFEISDNDE